MTRDGSEESEWLAKMKRKLTRTIFLRKMESAENFDNSASPIYLEDVRAICHAFARANIAEAAERKFAIKNL